MNLLDLIKDGVRQAVNNAANMAVISVDDPAEAQAVRHNMAVLNGVLQDTVAKWFAADGENNG